MRNANGMPSSLYANGRPHEGMALDNHPVEAGGSEPAWGSEKAGLLKDRFTRQNKEPDALAEGTDWNTRSSDVILMPAERITAPGSIARDLGESWCVRTRFVPRHQYRGHIHDAPTTDRQRLCPPRRSWLRVEALNERS